MGESLRYLYVARTKMVAMMNTLTNQITSLLVTAPEAIREKYLPLPAKQRILGLARCRPSAAQPDELAFDILTVLKTMAATYRDLEEKAATLLARMQHILELHHPALLEVYGSGPVTAAALVIAAGANPERIRSEAAFAKLCGACPIPEQ